MKNIGRLMLTKQPKPRKCKSCGELFKPFSTTAKACSMSCALDLAGKETKKKIERQNREQKKAFLDNDKSFQRAKAQKVFNEFIRLRDARDGCISCDKDASWDGQWHAGHYKTVGARPDLRFNEDNCNKQCSRCNNFLSGKLTDYRVSLIKKIGIEAVRFLETNPESPKKYTAQDYKAIHDHYKAKIKQLKQVIKDRKSVV